MATKTWIIRDIIGQLFLLVLSSIAWLNHWPEVMFLSLGLALLWQLCSAGLWAAWHPYSFRKPWIRRAILALVILGLALFPKLYLLIVFPFLEALVYFFRSLKDLRTVFLLHRSFWDI